MKMSTLKLKIFVACAVVTILFAEFCFSSELMFQDTFDTDSGFYVNDDTSIEGRQFGTLAPLDYTGDGDSLDNAIIGDTEKPNMLILENEAYISPNYNFINLATNFNIEFDVKINRVAGTSWAGFGLHIGAEDQHDVINDDKTGIVWWLQKPNGVGEGGPVLNTSGGAVAALGNRIRFKNMELIKLEDESVHVNCIVSTKGFGGEDKVTTACFINGEPITAHQRNGTIGYGTVFELDQSFTNNYLIYGFTKESSVDCNVQVDNFVIRKTIPSITVHDWTNDATSLISSSKTYTHAVNCFGGDVIINGVQFTGATVGTHPYDSATNWVAMDYNNNFGMGTGSDSGGTTIIGSGSSLVDGFFYSRISSTLMLYNLIPGLEYTLTLYNNSSTATLNTRLIPSDSGAALSVVDQNRGSMGSVFRYTYKAPSNGVFSMTFDNSPVDSGDPALNFRLYAFSNEIASDETNPVLTVSPTILNLSTDVDSSTNAEFLVENIGGGIVSGTVTGILTPFSISTNWYSATSNSPCTLTVTFSPVEEGNFTNVINLSGVGGSQDVTLIGEAVPECSLFLGYLLSMLIIIGRLKRI